MQGANRTGDGTITDMLENTTSAWEAAPTDLVPYILSLGVMGEMGSTMVGVLTPFLFDRAPPWREAKDSITGGEEEEEEIQRGGDREKEVKRSRRRGDRLQREYGYRS
jgi:hypothetical protein